MALGSDIASSLGLGKTVAIIGLLITVILSGAAVSIAGPIGFIGLAVRIFTCERLDQASCAFAFCMSLGCGRIIER